MSTVCAPIRSRLRDGNTVITRAVNSGDGPALTTMYSRCSPESLHMRFFSYAANQSRLDVGRLTRPSSPDHFGFVAVCQSVIVGVAYVEGCRILGQQPEVALIVDDDHHADGVGTLLLERLTAWALGQGIEHVSAEVLTANAAMLGLLQDFGGAVFSAAESGVTRVAIGTSPRPIQAPSSPQSPARATK